MSFELMRRSPERVELRSANEDEAEEKLMPQIPQITMRNHMEEVEKLCHPRAEYALGKRIESLVNASQSWELQYFKCPLELIVSSAWIVIDKGQRCFTFRFIIIFGSVKVVGSCPGPGIGDG